MTGVENLTSWTSQIKPVPGGVIGRVIPAALALLMYGTDVWLDASDYFPTAGFLYLMIPYLSLVALSFGVRPSVSCWYLSVILIGLAGMPAILVFALIFPTVIVMAVCCYLLPWKIALLFPISAIGVLNGLYLLIPDVQLPSVFILSMLSCLAAAAGLSLNIYRRRNERSVVQIRDLEHEQALIRGNERTQLAHELHDIVAHDVTVMAMQARRAEFVKDPDKTAKILEGIGEAAQQTLQDLRSLVLLLKQETSAANALSGDVKTRVDGSEILDFTEMSGETTTAVGFVHDLDKVVEALQQSGFHVRLQVEGEVARIPASLRQALRRTVRELGTNVLKHAEIKGEVGLGLAIRENSVELESTNEVSAVSPIMSSHTGLEAMRARCEVFGGFVDAGQSNGRWSTTVTIPLERSSVSED